MKHNTGDYNTGYGNTGCCNTGNRNTGDRNTGDRNKGHFNTGNYNTGNLNTGDRNTGYRNTGCWNTGDRNTGCWNTGDRNTGDSNTGCWNTGSRNTGYCNSVTPEEILVFNKPTTTSAWDEAEKPGWMYAERTEWVYEYEMSDKEKEANPSYVTTGGYLKAYSSLTHAYIEAWEKATEEDRELTRTLPNFDEQVFEEVFGFNPWKKKKTKAVTLELTEEQLKEIQKVLDK